MKLLCDAHTHFVSEKDIEERLQHQITSLVCNSTIDEITSFLERNLPSFFIPTCGVHPWSADRMAVKEIEPFLRKVPVIGEIGMDHIWCDVPLDIQQKVFEEQLALACELKKPVILHTKGQEKEIAAIIKNYPNRYLIHWYSCDHFLEDYIEQNCYFSIGPDVWWNPSTRNVARNVPSDRILTETDGLNAVQWAYDEAPDDKKFLLPNIPLTTKNALELVIRTISSIRGISEKDCSTITYKNLVQGFLK